MDAKQWATMTPAEKDAVRDNSDLTPVLIGLEGWRVEVMEDHDSKPRRFIVGKSTGWRPCHLEINNRRSMGGIPARKSYVSVRKLYYTR